MRKNELVVGSMFLCFSIVLFIVAQLTESTVNALLIAFGSGTLGCGIMLVGKYFYWNMPENRERCTKKLVHEAIEAHDELNIKLRDKSGRYANVLGAVIISLSIVIFSILGALEIIDNTQIIILYLGGYLIFQIIINCMIFYHLLKKY